MRRRVHPGFIVLCSLWLAAWALAGHAAPATASGDSGAANLPVSASTQACRSEVLKFEETVAFVRQSQGNDAARTLREKLLPAKLESDLLMSEGYCGLSRYLREKKLIR
ncbi:MAG: hypothetical protein ACT4NV_19930 [Rhodoferax sp.]